MAARIQASRINKTDRRNPHERILRVGGISASDTRRKMTQKEAIAAVERGEWGFCVQRGGYTANVIVARSAYCYKYLRTEADGEQPENLLSLPECP